MLIALMICRAKKVHTPVLSQVLVYKKENKSLYRSNLHRWRETNFKVCTNLGMWKKPAQINISLMFHQWVRGLSVVFPCLMYSFMGNIFTVAPEMNSYPWNLMDSTKHNGWVTEKIVKFCYSGPQCLLCFIFNLIRLNFIENIHGESFFRSVKRN